MISTNDSEKVVKISEKIIFVKSEKIIKCTKIGFKFIE
jgi:hypothetical protein